MRHVYALLLLLTLASSALLAWSAIRDDQQFHEHGWDARLYCEAARTDAAGGNPYLSQNYPFQLPWVYPPALLSAFARVCGTPITFSATYPAIYLGIAGVCVWLWEPRREWPLAIAIAASSFCGMVWCLLTGNVDMLLLAPVSLSFTAARHARWQTAGACLGAVAAVKILPVVYLVVLLFAPTSWNNRAKAVATGLAAFLGFFALFTLPRTDLAVTFIRQVTGSLPGQLNPSGEFGGVLNPALPFLAATLLGWPDDATAVIPGVTAAALLTAAFALTVWLIARARRDGNEQEMIPIALAFLALHMILPRLKPYSFVLLTPALFCVARVCTPLARCLLLAAASLWPALCLYLFFHGTKGLQVPTYIGYSQQVALMAAILIGSTAVWRRGKFNPTLNLQQLP